jgi:hypothetical protein
MELDGGGCGGKALRRMRDVARRSGVVWMGCRVWREGVAWYGACWNWVWWEGVREGCGVLWGDVAWVWSWMEVVVVRSGWKRVWGVVWKVARDGAK